MLRFNYLFIDNIYIYIYNKTTALKFINSEIFKNILRKKLNTL